MNDNEPDANQEKSCNSNSISDGSSVIPGKFGQFVGSEPVETSEAERDQLVFMALQLGLSS